MSLISKKKCFLKFFNPFLIGCLLFGFSTQLAGQTNPFYMDTEDALDIVINNRVLAKVNDKAITVIDVMKKMDMIFFREFPEYASLKQARYQFYTTNWKYMLQDLVDKELVLADAEENKLPINNGEVRQEMEVLFGPNIIANLDRAGLTMEEAWKIVQNDIMIRRMLMYRVNTKAMRQVNPQDVRNAYEQYVKDHVRSDEWAYQFVSIRHPDNVKSAEVAQVIFNRLKEGSSTLDNLSTWVQENFSNDSGLNVTTSKEFRHKEQEISPLFKEILLSLEAGSYSPPVSQKSRNDNAMVYRIFYLKENVIDRVPPFQEMAAKLKEQLIEKAIDAETARYLDRLRLHFGMNKEQWDALLPTDFQPFSLQTQRLK